MSEPTLAARADIRIHVDHIVDVATVIVISLAAVATAWCGYQASRWSALQALDYSRANGTRIEASVVSARADALRLIDVGLFVQYEAAVFRKDDAFAEYLRRRFRPEFRAAVDAWLATKPQTNSRAPLSPFSMPQYHLQTSQGFVAATKRADDWVAEAVRANDVSDRYVFITVLFASVTFLGGVAIKARYPWNLVLTSIGIVLLVISAARMFEYPVR